MATKKSSPTWCSFGEAEKGFLLHIPAIIAKTPAPAPLPARKHPKHRTSASVCRFMHCSPTLATLVRNRNRTNVDYHSRHHQSAHPAAKTFIKKIAIQ